MNAIRAISVIGAMSAIMASPCFAQHAPMRLGAGQDSARVVRDGWTAIRVVKWTTALASAGTVAYGFVQNWDADREYQEIELMCKNEITLCATKPDSDEYADPALEARYNAVLERDERAQLALMAGQVGLAASVLLFILDLPKGTTTNDIPYDPSPLRLGMRAEQVALALHLRIQSLVQLAVFHNRAERGDHLRIDLRPAGGADLIRGRGDRPRPLVGPFMRQCVEHIGNRHDAPDKRDLITRQAARVTHTVPALVMGQRNLFGHTQYREPAA